MASPTLTAWLPHNVPYSARCLLPGLEQYTMTRRMLIDATHPEETRVTVVDGNRLEEFDYETTTKKQLKGNIYLAKVTRVEPSLQAAFVEYGGNRHGFLAFSEIHPDYYRIPVADREDLIDESSDDDDDDDDDRQAPSAEDNAVEDGAADDSAGEDGNDDKSEGSAEDSNAEDSNTDDNGDDDDSDGGHGEDGATSATPVEDMGGDEAVDEAAERSARRRPRMRRNYKIQEVVKRRQVMLVQVVKEERGNKGAALTTYLSLAGRYCVVMPNTSRGGGVSRKISNPADRKRLKTVLADLEVPDGMAVILRTAGAERSKTEIKRDFEYITKVWDDIRSTTLASTAPSLIHEEGNLVKRSIRDLYSKDIDEILVSGDDAYKLAKNFMKALIPSHAKKVQPYKDEQGIPLFQRYQVEQQLIQIHDPMVQLRSGGSIVLHQTEALVAIDVNSGKATRERHIEETALKTNLEAAEEVARQLRLRDMAGLVVIDFIDMEENRNAHAVERKLKEALRRDRARIQVGRISAFGLLEMSRQRLRPSLIEAMSSACPTCGGVGYIVSTETAALIVLRALEEEGLRHRANSVTVTVPGTVALYLLNNKRAALSEIEETYILEVSIEVADGMLPPAYEMTRLAADGTVIPDDPPEREPRRDTRRGRGHDRDKDRDRDRNSSSRRRGRAPEREDEETPSDVANDDNSDSAEESKDDSQRRRKRGRRRRRYEEESPETNSETSEESSDTSVEESSEEEGDGESQPKRRRKRGRRGGRRRGRGRGEEATQTETDSSGKSTDAETDAPVGTVAAIESNAEEGGAEESGPEVPVTEVPVTEASAPDAPTADAPTAEAPADAAPSDGSAGITEAESATVAEPVEAAEPAAAEEAPTKAKRGRRKASTKKATAKKAGAKKSRAKKASAKKPAEAKPDADVADAPVSDAPAPVSETPAPASTNAASTNDASTDTASTDATDEARPAPFEVKTEADPDKPKRKGWWSRVIG